MARRIGEHALQHLSGKFTPSELPQAQQDAIQDRFAALTSELEGPEAKDLELLIRKSTIGPNAIALPGNYIVLTDELVTLVDGDLDAISGVLGHEVGHLHHKHGLRSVAQAAALTVLGSALIGDYSSVLALVPTALGHLNYSRRFESEADVYARTMLCTNGIDPAKTSLFFDRAGKLKGNLESVLPGYLQSHPASAERADYFRTSCQKAP